MNQPQNGFKALNYLVQMGFQATVAGDAIRLVYKGEAPLDRQRANLLIAAVTQDKEQVLQFLRWGYCPRCGGIATCPACDGQPLCLKCDWGEIIRLYPGMVVVNHGR
jgi:hypothetical protein